MAVIYQTNQANIWFLLVLILLPQNCQSWGWFFSSNKQSHSTSSPLQNMENSDDFVAEFSVEPFNNQKGKKLIDNAKRKMVSSSSCWQKAYGNLFAGCSEILAGEEHRKRLAWHLSDCFQKDTGRLPFPYCDPESPMIKCLKNLDEASHKIYLEFYLETNSICHQLQIEAFKHQTERLVNELKSSAQFAEDKLDTIQEQAEQVLNISNQIHEHMTSIDLQTQTAIQMSKNVEEHVSVVLKHSEAVYEQSKGIANSQSELIEGQEKMKKKFDEGLATIHDAYNDLNLDIITLGKKAVEIEEEVTKVGDAMYSKMNTLQSKADDIGNVTGISLDKQKELLDGQSAALEGLQSLTKFQSRALTESRNILQQLAEFGNKQQNELLKGQEQLQKTHNSLIQNSKSILAAQETFESKQASMFIAIDKLFALHNAMLLESRLIKTFLVYSLLMFVLYMFTSTKQTYTVRPRIYMGLCLTFLAEFTILRYAKNDIGEYAWMISLVRSLFVLLALIQLLYAIYTYRDYEVLNHQMLLTLIEKVNGIQYKEESSVDMDSEVNWSSWIGSKLPDGVDDHEDPDYILPEHVGENSVTSSSTRRYNLRSRSYHS